MSAERVTRNQGLLRFERRSGMRKLKSTLEEVHGILQQSASIPRRRGSSSSGSTFGMRRGKCLSDARRGGTRSYIKPRPTRARARAYRHVVVARDSWPTRNDRQACVSIYLAIGLGALALFFRTLLSFLLHRSRTRTRKSQLLRKVILYVEESFEDERDYFR